MPHFHTVRKWAIDDVQGFYAQYTRARDIGLDMLADEILDGTAKPAPEGVDLRIWFDARRWYLSKLAPKRYGDKLTQELTGSDGTPLNSIPSKIEIVLVPTPKAPEHLGSGETPRALPAPTVPALKEQDPGEQLQPRRNRQQPPRTPGVWN